MKSQTFMPATKRSSSALEPDDIRSDRQIIEFLREDGQMAVIVIAKHNHC